MVKKKALETCNKAPPRTRDNSWKARQISYDPDMSVKDRMALKAEAAWWGR